MEIVLIIAVCFIALWIWSLVVKAKANTPVGRINNGKKAMQWGLRKEWRAAKELGSSENVEKWLRRKLMLIDDEWLAANRAGRNDEQLIEHAINHVFSQPRMIDHLLKQDQEERLQELEE